VTQAYWTVCRVAMSEYGAVRVAASAVEGV
jgi:hypothetical protein